MTALALNQLIRGTPAFLQRLGHRFTSFVDGIGEARAMAENFKTLSRLTDAQLAQRGLKREDIPRAVLASFGRK
jgi:uncharacterized protein YjiS (DUF1127 family)